MTEEQIERGVERKFDRLDRRFIAGPMSQAEYDAESAAIGKWADEQTVTVGE